jgi:hypothetical protein
MGIPTAFAILIVVLGAVPPLTDSDRARLAVVLDGGDFHDDAFAALIEHVGLWGPGLGDTPVRLEVDPDQLLADPAANRGKLFQLAGTLEQPAWLPPPDDAIAEWFVRDAAGRPMLVYVCGLTLDDSFHDGQAVTLPARFYKRIDARARDGRIHGYAAFVGAYPRPVSGGGGLGHLWKVVVPVAVMLVVFLVLLVYARRGDRPARRVSRLVLPVPGGEPPLPDDPVEALGELRRRAGAQDS